MKATLFFLVCWVSCCLVAAQAAELRILGGYVDEYSLNSKDYYGKAFEWGQSEAVTNSEARLVAKMYCSTVNRKGIGFCYHHLVVFTGDSPTKQHYQIVGSCLQIYNSGTLLETKHKNGITEATNSIQKIQVSKPKIWSGGRWRYGDLFFFVQQTSGPSITKGISLMFVNSRNHADRLEEEFWKCHDGTSERVLFYEVGSYTSKWKANTIEKGYFWRSN